MSIQLLNKYSYLNQITNNNNQNQFQLNLINQYIYDNNQLLTSVQQQNQQLLNRLSTYTKNSNDITISQPLLGDQLYSITLTSNPNQYVQCQDFLDLKKVVLGIDLVNNFQSTLESVGGMDDQLKLLVQKTTQIVQDDVNNILTVNVPLQSSNATQTTSEPKQYITYYQHNNDINALRLNNISTNADITVSNFKIINVADPTDAQDAATKNYTDTQNNIITTKLSTYTKNENNVTISQQLLGDQVYPITGTTDVKQYVQAQDFIDLKKVVLGVDLVNNYQSQLQSIGGMDDQLKVLAQKTAQLTQDDTNNILSVSVPIQSSNATQTTTNAKQYVTYHQFNAGVTTQNAYNTANDLNITGLKNATLIQDTSIAGTKLQGTSAANNGNSYLNNKGTFSTITSFSNNIDAGGFRITNLADPQVAQDAATLNWVKNVVFASINTYISNNSIQIAKLIFPAASGSGTKVLYDDGIFRTM